MRVLIATGGAAHSEIAIRQLAELALTVPVQATVLNVVHSERDRERSEEILAHAVELLEDVVEEVDTLTAIGTAAEEIVREGQTGKYDLILMGDRRTHSLLSRLRGAVTQQVVNQTSLPVLVAKQEARPIERILICDSGVQSPTLLQLFSRHLPALLTNVTEIALLHVMSQISAAPGIPGVDLRASAEELIEAETFEGTILERDVAFLNKLNLSPIAIVRHGLVVDEIVEEARAGDYDLVVIGAHREENLPWYLLDDQARDLLLTLDRATLVIR